MKKLVLYNENKIQGCRVKHCFNFVFIKADDGMITCKRCSGVIDPAGLTEGPFPRPAHEYWDKYHDLPSFAFLLGPEGNSVKKVEMQSGLYKEGHAVSLLIDEMQSEIFELRARLERLTLKSVK